MYMYMYSADMYMYIHVHVHTHVPSMAMSTPGSRDGICSMMGRMWSTTMCLSKESIIFATVTRHLTRSWRETGVYTCMEGGREEGGGGGKRENLSSKDKDERDRCLER